MVILIAVAYAILSVFVGSLIQVSPAGSSLSMQSGGLNQSTDWWNSVLIINSSDWVLTLPLLATVTLILVAIGVALALGACVVLVGSCVRSRGHAATAGSAGASIAPAVVGLATHGVCCCAACTATLSIGVVASVSGTNIPSHTQLVPGNLPARRRRNQSCSPRTESAVSGPAMLSRGAIERSPLGRQRLASGSPRRRHHLVHDDARRMERRLSRFWVSGAMVPLDS